MATLEELQNHKPVIDTISDFFKKQATSIFIIIGVVCCVLGAFVLNGINFQKCIFFLTLLFFIINLYLCWLSKHGKNLPKFIRKSNWIMTLILIAIAVITFFTDKEHNIKLPIAIIVLCLVNHVIAGTYKHKWDMPSVLFGKIITLQGLGVIIAGLQLIIAYPQLKSAYKSVSNDQFIEFNKNLNRFYSHVEDYVFVDIPDSLMNEDVRRAKMFQKQLYTYSLFIINANWDRSISVKSIDADSILQTTKFQNNEDYKQLKKKKNMKLLTDYAYNYLALEKIENVYKRLGSNSIGAKKMDETLLKITSYYYSNTADSTLLISQINNGVMANTLEALSLINESLSKASNSVKKYRALLNEIYQNPSTDIFIKVSRTKNIIQSLCKELNNTLAISAYNDYINGLDAMCGEYIAFLNLMQLKYAYKVDLDIDSK
ncbi:MAG: hypothetical protein MJY76_02415 [Bacteroidales bacterium]|nr:hypothetical protein [Bacteroidales bacterium]